MQYRFNDLNVDLIQDPYDLLSILKAIKLKGKVIKNIKIVGHCYDIIETFEEIVYEKLGDEKIIVEMFKDDYEFDREIEYDDPIIFEFEDGDKFEIDYGEGSSLKLGINSLPENIECGCNNHNLDGNIMFSNIIGHKILGFEVGMQDDFELTYDFTGSYGIKEPKNQKAYISFLRIILNNGLSIYFSNDFDYGYMSVKEWNETSKIKWKDVKKGIIDN